jgi:RNA polymerase sigma-70 factor (ECF subfamily)
VTEESTWIQQAREGDQSAFGRLVVAYQTPVYNLAYRMLGSKAEAEDAAQEAFLRAYIHLRSFDSNRPFRSWLLSIASHYCIDRLRRRRITWIPLEDEFAEPYHMTSKSPNPETVTSQKEQEEQVQQLLDTLSPTDRAAITLRYWYDCSYEEIAEMLNLTTSAVKSRLHRARRALADSMEGESSYAMQTG